MSLDRLNAPISPADAAVATDIAGLARLKSQARTNSPEALAAVAQQFEALFLDMMLKSMRDASLGDGIFDSDSGDLYRSMFDRQVALDMARGKGLGIAEMLIRQLSPQAPLVGKGDSPLFHKIAPASTNAVPEKGDGPLARSPADFVREVLPHARAAARELGVNPLALVAQAALETGWGKRIVAREDGTSSLNLFGIKAGAGWQGATANARTLEFEGGLPVPRSASFRSYGSIAESFADYVSLLSMNPRYGEVLEAGADPGRFAESMGRSGYATDPEYGAKLKGVLDGDTLRDALATLKDAALAALKNSEGQPI